MQTLVLNDRICILLPYVQTFLVSLSIEQMIEISRSKPC